MDFQEWLQNGGQKIIDDGLRYIERIKSLNKWDENGALLVPFRCYGCDKNRFDFCMMTGDGVPLCSACFEGTVKAVGGTPPCDVTSL